MSNSPIFDQLVTEFAAKGTVYDEFVKWSAPAFMWTPQHVVQLDKQPKTGVNFVRPKELLTEAVELLSVPKVTGINDRPELLSEHIDVGDEYVGRVFQDYIAKVGEEFYAKNPTSVITDIHLEPNGDGSSTVVIEAVKPITSVKPLSERNTAQPME